jgi:toxin-antitoxin system PIN domain toxin
MIYLPDVNVWIALTSNRHVHHQIASEWLHGNDQARLAFCRVSELGFLRLLTNAHVMGKDVLSPTQAWAVYDEWQADDRVVFLAEGAGFGQHWRLLGNQISGGSNAWTDAYLAAFAIHVGATVVTLDRAFSVFGKAAIKSLL